MSITIVLQPQLSAHRIDTHIVWVDIVVTTGEEKQRVSVRCSVVLLRMGDMGGGKRRESQARGGLRGSRVVREEIGGAGNQGGGKGKQGQRAREGVEGWGRENRRKRREK